MFVTAYYYFYENSTFKLSDTGELMYECVGKYSTSDGKVHFSDVTWNSFTMNGDPTETKSRPNAEIEYRFGTFICASIYAIARFNWVRISMLPASFPY